MSLKKQITIVFFVLVTCVIVTTMLIIRYYSERLFLEEFRKEALVLANTLASQSKRALLTRHFSSLMFQIQAMAEQDNILYVMVCSLDGKIRAHNDFDMLGKIVRDEGFWQARAGHVFVKERQREDNWFYQIAVPVKLQGQVYGVAEIGYDLTPLQNTFRLYNYFILIISSLGIIIGPLICLRIADRITAPILRLQNAAQDFAGGKFDVSVPVESSIEEVAQLGRTFNKMTSVIKRTIFNLKSSYLFVNKIVTTISDILLVVDEDGNIIKLNAAAVRAIGAETTYEIRNRWRLQDLFVCHGLEFPLSRHRELSSQECTLLAREGEIPVLVSLRFLINKNGRDLFVFTGGVIKEIKMKEEQLRREHQRLSAILQSLREGVIVVDDRGIITLVNREVEKMTGLKEEQTIGRLVKDILNLVDEETSRPIDMDLEDMEELEKKSVVLKSVSGEDRVVLLNSAPITLEDQIKGLVIVIYDISEKIRLEREIIKAQKIEALGLLAGGIAHDFNNMLMGIQGYINLTQISCSRGEKQNVENFLVKAEKAVDQARDLAQQLLVFTKGGTPVKTALLLQDMIKEIASFVVRGSSIKMVFEIDDDLWPIEADPSQISQVLNNLLINAVQAMPEGGNITLRARNIILESGHITLKPGKYIQIQVQDQGCGIPRSLLPSIFDPYFTTKTEGNGLGLAVVHSIIKKHGGHIAVASRPGEGTLFTIHLPATEKEPEHMDQTMPSTVMEKGGRILILDDEDLIREVLSAMLQNLGFETTAVAVGEDMLRIYREAMEKGDPFIMVITDLTLPGQKSGLVYAEELRKLDPDAVIVAVSGYANDPVMANPGKFGFKGAISKPFKLGILQQALADILSRQDRH